MGGAGENAQDVISTTPNKGLQVLNARASAQTDPHIQKLLSDYGAGKISLQEALSGGNNGAEERNQAIQAKTQAALSKIKAADPNYTPDDKLMGFLQNNAGAEYDRENPAHDNTDYSSILREAITTDPILAQKYGQDELQNGALTKGYFGQGGMQDQLLKEQNDLSQKGFQLTPEDHEAYGQASGDIARMFGTQEQGAAQSLADRGLAAAPSGAAGAAFSGIQGNKSEQLARAQMDIADRRMQNTQQRLQTARTQAMQLGALGQNAMSNLYNRNLAGRQQNNSEAMGASGQQMAQTQAQQNQLNTAFEQQQETKGPSFGDIMSSIGGGVLSAATGGIGTALGGAASSLFNGGKKSGNAGSNLMPDYDPTRMTG